MKVVQVQFIPWDKVYNFKAAGLELSKGDWVIVKTDIGTELGRVVDFAVEEELPKEETDQDKSGPKEPKDESGNKDKGDSKSEDREIKPVVRKANAHDLEKKASQKEKTKALAYCKEMAVKHELPMKLVDVNFSFDGSRLTFAFIADGRIDFRELVKDLTRHFNRTIRLHQIGIRDEAKFMGDYGHCGRDLCCKKFLNDLTSITSDMAERQQVVHRGSERISGICGRLMCCLAYEEEGYEALAKRLPAIGAKVNVDGQRGIVVGHHILKQSVNVEFVGENGEGSTIVEVDLNRSKK